MVNFVAKSGVNTGSSITLLPPFTKTEYSWKNGSGKVVAFQDDALWYKITDIDIGSKAKLKTLFKGNFVETLFKGADTIQGSEQGDTLVSFAGNDIVKGNGGSDLLNGLDGNDQLFGQGGNDKLFGSLGNDILDGGLGWNEMTGGPGADRFVFDTPLDGKGGGGIDTIRDFETGIDKIQLDSAIFKGFGKGQLRADQFFTAETYEGQKNAIIWEKGSGELSYAKNGGSLEDSEVFAITGSRTIAFQDILIA